MLNSCAPGVTVVNIDNGFGAGVFAARVARNAAPRDDRTRVIGWVDASSGASGDMLLGALVGAGVPLDGASRDAVRAVAPEHVALAAETVTRNGFAATRCHVEVADSSTHRTWRDVARAARDAELADGVRARAHATFERLAVAEAAVHGTAADDVHFHEVGALDAIADVVGVCAGLEHLGLDELVVSPVAVGSGTVRGAHGEMPVPPPAVAELLRGVPSYAGPGGRTRGAVHADRGGAAHRRRPRRTAPQPAMTVAAIGVGAGGRDPATHANVLRLLVGEPTRRARALERRDRSRCCSRRTSTTSTRGCGRTSSRPCSPPAPRTPG